MDLVLSLGFLLSISLLTDGIFELCYVFKCWLCWRVVFVDLFAFLLTFPFLSASPYLANIVYFNLSDDFCLSVSLIGFCFIFYFFDLLVCLLEYLTLIVSGFSLLRAGLRLLRVDLQTLIPPVDADFLILFEYAFSSSS